MVSNRKKSGCKTLKVKNHEIDSPTDVSSPLDLCQDAILGIYRVYWKDLEFKWTKGTEQRSLNQQHLEHLKGELATGIRRRSPDDFIIVTTNQSAFTEWHEEAGLDMANTREDENVYLENFYAITGKKLEVQVGQHRLHALYQLLADSEDEVWWTAVVIDEDKVRLDLLEQLRMNKPTAMLEDGEAELWLKLDAFVRGANDLTISAIDRAGYSKLIDLVKEPTAEKQQNLKVKVRFKSLYDGIYHDEISSLLRYPGYRSGFLSGCCHLWERQRIAWYYKPWFADMIALLQDIAQSKPTALTVSTIKMLAAIPCPRTAQSIATQLELKPLATLGYPETGFATQLHSWREGLFPGFTSSEVLYAVRVLSDTYQSTPIMLIPAISTEARGRGNLISALCQHVCRWVLPASSSADIDNKQSTEDYLTAVLLRIAKNNRDVMGQDSVAHTVSEFLRSVSKLVDIQTVNEHKKPKYSALIKLEKSCSPAEYSKRFFFSEMWAKVGILAYETFKILDNECMSNVTLNLLNSLTWGTTSEATSDEVALLLTTAAITGMRASGDLISREHPYRDEDWSQLETALGPVVQAWCKENLKRSVRAAQQVDEKKGDQITAMGVGIANNLVLNKRITSKERRPPRLTEDVALLKLDSATENYQRKMPTESDAACTQTRIVRGPLGKPENLEAAKKRGSSKRSMDRMLREFSRESSIGHGFEKDPILVAGRSPPSELTTESGPEKAIDENYGTEDITESASQAAQKVHRKPAKNQEWAPLSEDSDFDGPSDHDSAKLPIQRSIIAKKAGEINYQVDSQDDDSDPFSSYQSVGAKVHSQREVASKKTLTAEKATRKPAKRTRSPESDVESNKTGNVLPVEEFAPGTGARVKRRKTAKEAKS